MKPNVRMARYGWAVVAVVAVLISALATGEKGSATTTYDPEELQFLQLINQYREEHGLGPLLFSDTLSVSSEHHSEDMAKYSFFAHNTAASSYYPEGSQPWDRMEAEGYDYNTYKGENIAVGYETADEVFQAWRESPEHNAAMLDGHYRVIGIAGINRPDSVHGWYWTTDFGGVVDPTSHAAGESPRGQSPPEPQQKQEDEPAQKPQEEPKQPPKDEGGIENGAMNDGAVWEQKAKDGADLVLEDGYARLGGYDDGADDLSQKIRVGSETSLAYGIRIKTDEHSHPFDRLLVRITNEKGEQLAVLKRYTDADAGDWRRHKIDLSRFAGRTVYVSFHARTDQDLLTTFYLDNVVLDRG